MYNNYLPVERGIGGISKKTSRIQFHSCKFQAACPNKCFAKQINLTASKFMTVASIGIKSSFISKEQINVDINKSDLKWFSERNWSISGKI